IMVSMAGGSVDMDVARLFVGPCVTFAGLVEGGANPQTFIPKLVEYYKKGLLPVDKLCTYYSFDDINKAFEDSHNGSAIKPVVVF
ncbi:MAG: NAD(P)-dependent alcohol dehydrogenase, partial [Oscillospiraceae bacterium]|nr:NAD(P)-dependent alcohol dehydrogenase [Oscillospiraceae bacterium]